MLVEIISSREVQTLQNKINKFLDDKSIRLNKIKFAQSEDDSAVHMSVLIIYEKIIE